MKDEKYGGEFNFSGLFQDKSLFLKNSRIFSRQNKSPGHFQDFQDAYESCMNANNLYGWAMSQYLPTGGFRWLTEKEINKKDLAKYKEDGKKGLISEVDLEYPQELHDLHNDYPLAPDKNDSNKTNVIPILRINKRKIQYQHRLST